MKKVTPHEKTQYRSLVQQLSWPAKGTLSTITYEVSTLQQRTEIATVQDMVAANRLLSRAQERCRNKEMLSFRPIKCQLAVAGVHDAGFGQQPGGSVDISSC